MNRIERRNLISRAKVLTERCEKLKDSKEPHLLDILKEYLQDIEKINAITSTQYEYIFGFYQSGGKNKIWGTCTEDAIYNAGTKYSGGFAAIPDPNSFIAIKADELKLLVNKYLRFNHNVNC